MAKKEEIVQETFEPKIISFAGVERGDIVYYVSKLLAAEGRNVLCIDNSKRNDLMTAIRNDTTDKETIETRQSSKFINDIRYRGSVSYAMNATFNRAVSSRFSYTVVYHGFDVDEEIWNASDTRFVMENSNLLDRLDLEKMMDALDVKTSPIFALYVDILYSKVNEANLEYTLIGDAPIEDTLLDEISLSFDVDDIAIKQAFQYNGVQKLSALTPSMKDFILAIFEKITGSKPAKPKKLIADAN